MKNLFLLALCIFIYAEGLSQSRTLYSDGSAVQITANSGVSVVRSNHNFSNTTSGFRTALNLSFGTANVFVGDSTAMGIVDASRNTIIGINSGTSLSALEQSGNSVLGSFALTKILNANGVIGVGYGNSISSSSNTISLTNTISLGTLSGIYGANISGTVNIGTQIGIGAGQLNSTLPNILVGNGILNNGVLRDRNIILGNEIGLSIGNTSSTGLLDVYILGNGNSQSLHAGRNSIFIGSEVSKAGFSNEFYENCLAMGRLTMDNSNSGSRIIAIGDLSSRSLTRPGNPIPSGLVAIGKNTAVKVEEVSSTIAIGDMAYGGLINDTNFGPTRSINSIMVGYSAGAFCQGIQSVNIGIGAYTLPALTDNKISNIAVGYKAGSANTSGNRNTFIGYLADTQSSGPSNSTALGNRARITTINQIVFGNADINSIEGTVAWSNYSDKRLKRNIEEIKEETLTFIKDLKPVYYTYKEDAGKKLHLGLIAQEVEESAIRQNVSVGALKNSNEPDGYKMISYAEITIPLLMAVQELDKKIAIPDWKPLPISANQNN